MLDRDWQFIRQYLRAKWETDGFEMPCCRFVKTRRFFRTGMREEDRKWSTKYKVMKACFNGI